MNVKATLVDGKVDPELSSDVAFEAAGADAVRKAMRDNMALLEPWMRVTVEAPEVYGGSLIGDISARGGGILAATGRAMKASRSRPFPDPRDPSGSARSTSRTPRCSSTSSAARAFAAVAR